MVKINIIDMDHTGNGIAKIDNKVIFIPKTVTMDICDIEIYKSYKNYDIGRLNKIIKKSPDRVDSICPYYQVCGGCNISNLDYQKQLEFKYNKVKNIFKKYLNIEIESNIIDSNDIYGYRNKITYHNGNSLGLISIDNKIIDIDRCLLVSDKVNNLYNKIKLNDISKVKKVMIRECNNGLILDILGNMDIENFKDDCLSVYMNNKCVYKKDDGYINIGNIKYFISNNSFFQVNTNNISKLYDEIVRYGNFNKKDIVIDLYCGVGSISLYIAKYVKNVLGIEIIKEAVDDANKNAKINKISNVSFICGDVSKLIDKNINGNKLIVDPPRVGLDKHILDVINKSKIDMLIYVSCDAMTLVRDIKNLSNYKLKEISIVDMFPQTHHCEIVTILERK